MNKPKRIQNLFRAGKSLLAATLLAAVITGCGDSNDDFVVTNTNVLAAPNAVNDTIAALGDATLNQTAANGVLANDQVNGATITAFDATGSANGTIVLNADGSFTYTPATGVIGAETFTYTLTNDAGSSTATVTLTSTGFGRFVDNSLAVNGTGTQASPFNNLADAVAAAQNGDTIFVARGDGTNNNLTGAINLPAGVNLVGEGTGLILAQTIVAQGQAPILTGPITCGGNNTISGVQLVGSADDAIIINGVGNVTLSNNTFDSPTNLFVDADNTTGTITVSNNTFQNPPAIGDDYLNFTNVNTNGDLSLSGNTFTNTANANVDDLVQVAAGGTSAMNVSFNNNIANGTQANQFDFGLFLLAIDTSDVTVNAADNQFNNFSNPPLIMIGPVPTAQLGGTVSGNTISNVNSDGIGVAPSNDTMTLSGNVISSIADDGLDIMNGSAAATIILDNNNITNAADDGIDLEVLGTGTTSIAIRNNTITGSGQNAIEAFDSVAANVCFDVTGNTVDANMLFDNEGGGQYDIERLQAAQGGPLTSVNTFNAGTFVLDDGTINSVAAGFCSIP